MGMWLRCQNNLTELGVFEWISLPWGRGPAEAASLCFPWRRHRECQPLWGAHPHLTETRG